MIQSLDAPLVVRSEVRTTCIEVEVIVIEQRGILQRLKVGDD